LNGLPDLQARRVRFVGRADDRIREDYLRILRFFRFHAWYGDATEGMDTDALAACAANSAGIDSLSRERIGHEMRRLLAAPDPAPAVAAMQATGVLVRILPGADARSVPVLVHLEVPYAPDWLRRLAVLGGDGHVDALRMSRDEARQFETLREGISSPAGAAELAYRYGADLARDITFLRAAVFETPLVPGWEDEVALGAGAEFPLRAADLMPDISGPELGARLKELEARWIASGFELSREQLLA
jgi:poly(A) polymerase